MNKSAVTFQSAAHPTDALEHFKKRLSFETDCWDVNHAIETNTLDFVLLDVRFR